MEKLHHANIIIGEGRDFVFEILLRNLNFTPRGNPDFFSFENQSFGIDDVRGFEDWVMGRPLAGEVKVSLIVAESITHEAQNALLKTLEEPPVGTYIFINLQSLGGLLPTFLSRVKVISLPESGTATKTSAEKFISGPIKERLSLARSLSGAKNKNEIKELIKDLEKIAYREGLDRGDLKNILTAKVFSSLRGSSPKMLLEWLSCVLQ